MTARRLWSVLAVILLGCVPAAPARAQGSGVTVDPGSPSGKEYAIPLETVRRQSDPRSSSQRRVVEGQRTAPLFGEGVGDGSPAAPSRPPATKPPASGSTSAGKGTHTSKRHAHSSAPLPAGAASAVVKAAVSKPGAPGQDVPAVLLASLAGFAAVAVGVLVGLAVRRRGQPSR